MGCDICTVNVPSNFVPPEGSSTPRFYIVGEAPGETEDKEKRPFVGQSGKLLRDALEIAGLSEMDIRIFNSVACRPTTKDGKNRTPKEGEVSNCASNLLVADIAKSFTRLEKIFCFGKVPFTFFKNLTGVDKDKDVKFQGIPVIYLYHPAYILRKGGKQAPTFHTWVENIKRSVTGRGHEKFSVDYSISSDIEDVEKLVYGEEVIGVDIESNGFPPYHENFRIVGAGFSLKDRRCVYYIGNMKQLGSILRDRSKKFLVYNVSFEAIGFFNQVGVHPLEVEYYDVHKLAVTNNIFMNLKDITVEVMDYENWSIEIMEILDAIKLMVKHYCESSKKNGVESVIGLMNHIKEKRKVYKYDTQFISSVQKCLQWYSLDQIENDFNMPMLKHYYNTGEKTVYYELAPLNMLAEYCCKDAYVLFDLLMKLLNSDLEQAFIVHNNEGRIGSAMIASGIPIQKDYLLGMESTALQHMLDATMDFAMIPSVREVFGITHEVFEKLRVAYANRDYETTKQGMKHTLNLNSNHVSFREKLSKIILTENTMYGRIMYVINLIKSSMSDFQLSNLIEIEEELKDFEGTPREKVQILIQKIKDIYPKITTTESATIRECLTYEPLADLQAKSFREVIGALKYLGDDLVDPLLDETRALRDYRIFKKAQKALSTYILGSCGIESTFDYDGEPDMDKFKVRLEKGKQKGVVGLQDGNFFICGATTRRWRAGSHTVPAKSVLARARTTHFGNNGIYLKYDHSQFELRVLATMAGEEDMKKIFAEGGDIHQYMADQVNLPRKSAKAINFGLIYGKHIKTIAEDDFEGDYERAERAVKAVFGRFSKIEPFIEMCRKRVKAQGITKNIFGEEITIQYDPYNRYQVGEAERQAVNYGIQSTASCLAGNAMYFIGRDMFDYKLKSNIIHFTHDSCEISCYLPELLDLILLSKKYAEDDIAKQFDVFSKIDFELGVNGGDLIEMKVEDINENFGIFNIEGNVDHIVEVTERLSKKFSVDFSIGEKVEKKVNVIEDYFDLDSKTVWDSDLTCRTYNQAEGKLLVKKP